jgi:chromatin remodeling complex protein RSC6
VQLGLTFIDKDHSFLEGEMAAKRKKKAKRKATKRKGAKRKATKRKATKRKATKRKATKRKATKRKGAKKKKATKRKATKRKAKKKKATKRKAAKRKVTKKKKAAKKKPAKKKAKKKSKRKPNPAFMRPLQPDALLAAVVGSKPLPRTEVTKQLWHYIRKNGLQDSVNRRMINADANLKAIFNGKSQVSMFEMTKLVSRHMA